MFLRSVLCYLTERWRRHTTQFCESFDYWWTCR